MTTDALLSLWSDQVTLSIAIWVVIAVAVLYLARLPAHAAILSAALVLVRQARRIASGCRGLGLELRRRGRIALLQLARESVDRSVKRHLGRLHVSMERDLASFPHLHRQLNEQITRIDEDYRHTVEAPPPPPEWLDAVESIARLPSREDPSIGRMLEDMHATLDRACHETLLAYRAASRRRHRVLRRMQPLWRRMDQSLETVQTTISRLHARTERLDARIAEYADVLEARPAVVRRLAASLVVRTLLSLLVLAGIGAAAVVDFNLLARPLAEIGAGSGTVLGLPFTAVTTGVVLVLIALTGGLLMEMARITRLFPETAGMDDRMRRMAGTAAAVLLFALIVAGAALAWTRDYLVSLDTAASHVLANATVEVPVPVFHWIPAITHTLLAVGLGLAVAVSALPLENLLRQGRVLALTILGGLLRLAGFTAAQLAVLIAGIADLLVRVYDVVIFLPLAGERALHGRRIAARVRPVQTSPDDDEGREDSSSGH